YRTFVRSRNQLMRSLAFGFCIFVSTLCFSSGISSAADPTGKGEQPSDAASAPEVLSRLLLLLRQENGSLLSSSSRIGQYLDELLKIMLTKRGRALTDVRKFGVREFGVVFKATPFAIVFDSDAVEYRPEEKSEHLAYLLPDRIDRSYLVRGLELARRESLIDA